VLVALVASQRWLGDCFVDEDSSQRQVEVDDHFTKGRD